MESSSDEFNNNKTRKPRARAKRVSLGDSPRAVRETIAPKAKEVVSRKVESQKAETPNIGSEQDRKAPTPFSASKVERSIRRKRLLITACVILVGIGASAVVGMTDGGQIDVQKTIEARNERIRNNQADERDTISSTLEVPVQNTSSEPGKRFKGRGIVETPPPPESEVSSSTASSTDETASSTVETVDSESGTEEPAVQEEQPTE